VTFMLGAQSRQMLPCCVGVSKQVSPLPCISPRHCPAFYSLAGSLASIPKHTVCACACTHNWHETFDPSQSKGSEGHMTLLEGPGSPVQGPTGHSDSLAGSIAQVGIPKYKMCAFICVQSATHMILIKTRVGKHT
jgi:hypothetical protein